MSILPFVASAIRRRRHSLLLGTADYTGSTLDSSVFYLNADGSTEGTLTATVYRDGELAVGVPVTLGVSRITLSAANSVVTAAPLTIESDGVDSSVITITVLDADGNALPGIPAASVVVAVSGSGNTVTQPATATDVNGQTTASFVSTGGGTKTVSVTVCGLAVTDTASVVVSGAAPILVEDFSTYSSTANLLADPRGIYNTVESAHTGDIVLDTTVGYGTSTQSMRYDWPNNGSVSLDYAIRPGVLEIPGAPTQVWVEYVVRFSTNFTVDAGTGSSAKEYKLASAGDITGGIGRWNIPEMQETQWVTGYPNSVFAVGGSPNPSTLWDGNPHVFRVEMKLSPSGSTGILRFNVDGTTKDNRTGFNTDGTHGDINYFAPGLNMNQGPNVTGMKLWWHRIAVYTSDPGWTF